MQNAILGGGGGLLMAAEEKMKNEDLGGKNSK